MSFDQVKYPDKQVKVADPSCMGRLVHRYHGDCAGSGGWSPLIQNQPCVGRMPAFSASIPTQ